MEEEDLRPGKNILLVAYGNIIHSLIIERLSPATIFEVEVATETPLIYGFDENFRSQE